MPANSRWDLIRGLKGYEQFPYTFKLLPKKMCTVAMFVIVDAQIAFHT